MLNLKKSVLKYKNQDGNMEDIGAIVVTAPQRYAPLIVNYNITPYSEIKNAYDNGEEVWALLRDEITITVPEKVILEAGVYDENDNLLVDWAELTNYKTGYAFDMDNDYSYDISSGFGLQSFRDFETGEIYNLYPFSSAMEKNTDLNPYTKVVIEEGSTKIGDYSFALSDTLTTIIIPDSVTSISNTAFFRCDNLKTIYYSGSAVNNGNNWGATNATVLPYSEAFNKLVDKTVERSIIATLSSSIDDTFTFSTVHESNKYELYCSEKNGWSCKTTLINTEEYFNNQKNKPNGIVGLDENGLIEDTLISDDIARVDDLMTIPYVDLVDLGVTTTINDDGSVTSTGFVTEYGSNDGDLLIEATQSEFVKFNVSIKKGNKTINKVVIASTDYEASNNKYIYTSILESGADIYLVKVGIGLSTSFVDVLLNIKILSSVGYVDSSINTAKNEVKNELLNGAGAAYDSLRELGDLIDDNTDAIEALEKIASSKADKTHIHDDRYYTESEIDGKLSTINKSIGDITNGTTVVKKADSSTKAEQDASGNVITETYETKNNANNKLTEAKKYTDEQFTKVSEQTLLNLAIKPTTDPATSLHIQDSAKYRVLDIGMQGKTEQKTTTGKNLLDIDENGVIDGTFKHENINIPAGTYKLTFESVTLGGSLNPVLWFYDNNVVIQLKLDVKEYNVTLTKDETKIYIYSNGYSHANSKGVISYVSKLMLREATVTDGTYEPYTGGIPSPNTEFPQEIVHAGRYNEETGMYEIDVEVVNKNLLPYPYVDTTVTRNGVTFTDNGDGSVTAQGIAERETYFVLNRSFNFNKDINAMGKDSGTDGEYAINADLYYNKTSKMLSINISSGATVDRIYYPQLENGTVSTPYVKHESQKVTLSSPRPFTKWDNFVKKDGLYGFVYRKIDLGFTGNWFVSDTYKGFLHLLDVYLGDSVRDVFCNQAIVKESNDNEEGALILKYQNKEQSAFYMINSRFYDESLSDKGLANWKAHLSENSLEVCTYTNEEEFIPVSQEEQTMLEALETYYGVTNITNSEECEMSIQYVADTKLYVDNKFTALATQIV